MSIVKLKKIKEYLLDLPLKLSDPDNPDLNLFGSIINIAGETIVIRLNLENVDSNIYLNKTYDIKIFRESSLFSFQGTISSIHKNVANIKVLSPINKIQNRKYFRLKVLGTATLYIPDLDISSEAIFYNISEGGLGIVTSQTLEKENDVFIDIPLIPVKNLKGIVLKEVPTPFFEIIPTTSVIQFIASMNDSIPKNLNDFVNTYNKSYAIEFKHENPKHPDLIRKFIFDTQLKRIEENKHIITY